MAFRSTAISGSLTQLVNGTSLLVAGTGITITTGSTDQITITAGGAQEFNGNVGITGSLGIIPTSSKVAATSGSIRLANQAYIVGRTDGGSLNIPLIGTLNSAGDVVVGGSATAGNKLILSGGLGTIAGGNVEIYAGKSIGAGESEAHIILSGSIIRVTGSLAINGGGTGNMPVGNFLLNFRGCYPAMATSLIGTRNIANTSNISILGLDAGDDLIFGDTNAAATYFDSANSTNFRPGGSTVLQLTSTTIAPNVGPITYISTVTGTISQTATAVNTVTAAPLTIQAQTATGTTTTGGKLILSAGLGSSIGGNVEIYGGSVTGAGTKGGNLILSGGQGNTLGGDIELIAGSGSTRHGRIELRTANKNIGFFKYDADPRFVVDGAAPYFLFEANVAGQFIFFQATGAGNAVIFQSPTVNFADATPSTAVAYTLSATGATSLNFVNTTTGTIGQNATTTNTVTAAPLTVKAQSATGTTTTGGKLILSGGSGTSLGGNVEIYAGQSTGAGEIAGDIILSGTYLQVTGNIAINPKGTAVMPVAGLIRVPNSSNGGGAILVAETAASNASHYLLQTDGGNNVIYGDGNTTAGVFFDALSTLNFRIGFGTIIQCTSTTIAPNVGPITYISTVTGTIGQTATSVNTVVGAPLTVAAQSATGTGTTGGKLILSGGDGLGLGGNIEIYAGHASKPSVSAADGQVILSGSAIVHKGQKMGYFGFAAQKRPTISGSKGANAALGSLLNLLQASGFLIDGTS